MIKKTQVKKKIAKILPILRRIAMGDFSRQIEIPPVEDEFTELFVTVRLMSDDLRELTTNLETLVEEKTAQLLHALTEKEKRNQYLADTRKTLSAALDDLTKVKARKDAILTSLADGVVDIAMDNTIVLLNPAAQLLLGVTLEEAIGLPYYYVWHLADASGTLLDTNDCPIGRVLKNKKTLVSNEYICVRKDGIKFPVSMSVAPVFVGSEVTGAIVIMRDYSKEKEIDREKSEFVSFASHQLRTPLTTIGWYTELLLGDTHGLTDKQKTYLEEIFWGNNQMVDLVNGLLNVSRIETGIFAIEPKPVLIADVVENVFHELENMIKTKAISIKKTYDKTLGPIAVDQKLMKMVIQNLLTNAFKYTPPGGEVRVTLKTHLSDVLLSVADTGYGIPKSAQGKIFTKLFRADNVREKEPSGTGLGLYIVKSILNQIGGRIWMESEEGKGSTFYVTIPLEGMKKREGPKGLLL